MSDSALKWSVLLYATCLVFAAFLAPRALWSQIFLKENDTWSALAQDGMGTMFGMLVALFVGAMLLRDIIKISESPGWRKASAWFVIRAVLAGLVIAIFWFGSKANRDIEQKADSLIEEALETEFQDNDNHVLGRYEATDNEIKPLYTKTRNDFVNFFIGILFIGLPLAFVFALFGYFLKWRLRRMEGATARQ